MAADPANPSLARSIVNRSRMAAGLEQVRGEPAGYPPLATQAGNLAGALWSWAVSGFSMASDEEQERRQIICLNCDQWSNGRCRLCGCYTSAKVRLRTEHCPLPEPKW